MTCQQVHVPETKQTAVRSMAGKMGKHLNCEDAVEILLLGDIRGAWGRRAFGGVQGHPAAGQHCSATAPRDLLHQALHSGAPCLRTERGGDASLGIGTGSEHSRCLGQHITIGVQSVVVSRLMWIQLTGPPAR